MRLRIAILCLMLILLASCASAFPLTGGNGQINATVLGTYFKQNTQGELDKILLEILIDWRGDDVEQSTGYYFLTVNLVDSDDKFYKGTNMIDRIGGTRFGKLRLLYSFDIPSGKNIEIKRVRITPPTSRGSPFSIEWTGVPEVKDASLDMKFYSIEREQDNYSETDSLSADIKITNNAQNEQKINNSGQFVLSDQFGFKYEGGGDDVMLLPGESMRFDLVFPNVSKLSRPVYLIYLPSNLTMDISAWA